MPVNKLFDYPHNVFLMLRLEFETFCEEDDLEAKIMRVIEIYVEAERKRLFQHKVNGTKLSPDEEVQIPRDIWVPISYKLFREEMYDLSLSDNALRTAIKSLEEKKLIEKKYNPKKRYDAPEYRFQVHVIDRLNALLKVSGGRKLIPSKIKALKKLAPQFLDPSGVQFLDPSIEELSTEENLRGAETSPNYNKDTNNTTNKETYDANASRTLADYSLEEIAAYLAAHTNQPELSTPIVDKSSTDPLATCNPIASDAPQPAQENENGSHELPPQGRAQPEKKPRAPRVQKPEKVVLTPQGQAFYTLYCSMPWVKIPPEITEKGREQCEKLGTTLTTQEQMFQLRNYMGKKAFFKGKGFSFALMIMAVNDMASEQPVSSVQAELQAAAPGFEVKSQVDLMRMMPEERRDYAKRLNAHLAANRTEKEKQALEYALKLEIV